MRGRHSFGHGFDLQDGFNSVRTVLIQSRWFQYCPDSFNSVWRVLILSREGDALLLYVARNGSARFVRKIFAREKPLSGKFYVFGPLLGCSQNRWYAKFTSKIWGRSNQIEFCPSEPKRRGIMCSIKSKCLSQKYALAPAQKPIVQRCQHKQVVFLVSRHDGKNIFGRWLQKYSKYLYSFNSTT